MTVDNKQGCGYSIFLKETKTFERKDKRKVREQKRKKEGICRDR
jgi:hypothetical protein